MMVNIIRVVGSAIATFLILNGIAGAGVAVPTFPHIGLAIVTAAFLLQRKLGPKYTAIVFGVGFGFMAHIGVI